MKYINLFFFLSVLAPMAVRADGCFLVANGNWSVPFQRIFDAVQEWPQLYDTDFVFLLGERVTDKNYTLQKVAQACIDYTDYNNEVTDEICTEFVAAAFGQPDAVQPVIESDVAVTDGVILTTTNMPDRAEIKITINAAGQFYVDCDNDGTAERTIENTEVEYKEIACTYDEGGVHEIKITGLATDYPEYVADNPGVIYFNESPYLQSVQGSLGSIFPTLDGVRQPIFAYAFSDCTGLTEIPDNLFSGVKAAADNMFRYTFKGCTSLKTIPDGLFSGVTDAANAMFSSTFEGCTSLTTIPKDLFKGVTGAAIYMFSYTFADCTSLKTIPKDLFKGVTGAASHMFHYTFKGCTSLTEIPDGLFDGVTGAAYGMFKSTFQNCRALRTIPTNLFSGVTGTAEHMFLDTFYGVPEDVVPDNVFPGVTGAAASGRPDATAAATAAGDMADTNGVILTTTNMPDGADIKITIHAAGHFEVDCDNDGKAEHEINSNTIVKEEVLCKYDAGGVHEIKITGHATDYPAFVLGDPGVIYFNESEYLQFVRGSLGAIFPTLDGVKQPIFAFAFRGCTSLTEIPADLFSDVTGAADGMFHGTFYGCTNLTKIPTGLFSGVNGAAESMFCVTFNGCTNLTEIPADLFSGVTDAAESMFRATFSGCSGLTTIPKDLFKGVTGAAKSMFYKTFIDCSGLREIPVGLFSGVTDAAESMFRATFQNCSALTTIPAGLFSGVTGTADYMFRDTFDGVPPEVVPDTVYDKMIECGV